jgi:hypothetical protein
MHLLLIAGTEHLFLHAGKGDHRNVVQLGVVEAVEIRSPWRSQWP